MEKSIMSRVVNAANCNDPNLAELCSNWHSRRSAVELTDPVTMILFLNRISWIEFWFCVAVGLITGVLALPLSFPVFGIWALLPIPLAMGLAVIVRWLFLNRHIGISSPAIRNALDFIQALEVAEGLSSDYWNSDFLSWDMGGSNFILPIKDGLKELASEKDRASKAPWRSDEAKARMEEWRIIHLSMVRLFPELPTDYGEYFPRVGK